MASSHAGQQPQDPAMAPMHPELLMAARCGDCKRLRDLLNGEDGRRTRQAPVAASQVVVDVHDGDTSGAVDRLLEGVTSEGDTALHVLVACRHCSECAHLIHGKASHLLDAPNKHGDTPLHCAARAGNVRMVTCLVSLARSEDGGGERVKAVLRKQNGRGETALHDAVRLRDKRMVQVLMLEDYGLARVPAGNGASPLYLAVFLGYADVARLLYDMSHKKPSYSGQDGQNALHAAVFRGHAMTKMVLDWNANLTKQRDKFGNTPLHFAASVDGPDSETLGTIISFWSNIFGMHHGPTKLILDADKSWVYQADNGGAFPIHVAASAGRLKAIIILLAKCPNCAGLRDAQGKTFLHIAVEKKRYMIVAFACQRPGLASILNMQDNDGNTALHLAVRVGYQNIFCCLMHNRLVCLNLPNNEGLTPLDLSWSSIPRGFYYPSNPRTWIHQTLSFVSFHNSSHRRDQFHEQYTQKQDENKDSERMTDSTQVLGIGAVLITTVTFAAAFTLPGGYRADDHTNGGTPTLAGSYAFDAFIISNTLAFICSLLATFGLMYSGVAAIDLSIRLRYLDTSVLLLQTSARSLVAAFAMGMYVVLAPVAHKIGISVCVMTFLALLYGNMEVWQSLLQANAIRIRLGIWAAMIRGMTIILGVFANFWSYIIIFGLPAYLKTHHLK